ncbi:putative uncharacterized protein DDB_G0282133 isoform X2 [Condylostylus longicornis]|uniref:putative uncharacterized protein DDB_G0282133 isoform X2 n=1 Tax=Condylostylus longicornis TaxID=2530218 RepID=UPI00244E40B6|nr:putative uncharacterized protein DDB_G0282133 isoform X2 [Condylostylus longicornis]
MLLLLLCFLMKLVDLSMLNRSRNNGSANNPNHQHNHHFYQNHNHHTAHNHNNHHLNHNNYNSNNNNNHHNHYNNKNMHYYDGSGNVGWEQQQHQQLQQQRLLLSGRRDNIYSGGFACRRPLSSTGSDSSHSSYSSSDSAKENRISNNINVNNNKNNNSNNSNSNDNEFNKIIILLLHQQKQQLIEEQLKKLTSQQYQQLLLQHNQQQQKYAEQQKQQEQQSKQQNLLSKQQLYNININDNSNSNNNFDINKLCSIKNNISINNNKKTWAEIGSKKCLGLNSDINIQGIKSHRGMTEHPNTESSSPLHKSSSLSSSPRRPPPPSSVFSSNINNQISCNNNPTIITSPKRLHPTTLLSPTKIRQNNRNFQQNYIQNSNISNQEILYKRPLTSPNATIFNLNNYYNNGMPYNYNTFNAYNNIQCSVGSLNDINDSNSSINGSNTSQDNILQRSIENELTEEHLKQNVAIVLNNLDRRYQNTLRSIILNEQINNLALSYNNNDIFSTSGQNNSNDITMMAANLLSSPVSGQDDYNSNPANIGQQHLTTFATAYGSPNTPGFTFTNGHLNCSIASSHDFTHDNSDYQWFLDYGYRDGVAHQSVLSSLSASYNGIGELSYYEDLAKDIDANLAEVDMESFRTEDIHSLLTHIPSFCSKKHTTSEIDNSICKSELLFSPVKESHISTDSLDLDAYQDDADIILTCKANKDNYTIAFEGSTLYSDESFYAEPNELNIRNRQNFINLHSNLDDIVKRKSLEVSMCRSDNAFTTWSKLKKNSALQLQRYPSGNNNTSINVITRHAPHCFVRKSSSLPNLRIRKEIQRQLNVSQAISTSTVDSTKLRNLLPMCQIPVSAISVDDCSTDQTNETGDGSSNVMHTTDESSIGNGTDCGSNGGSGVIKNQQQNQPAFNLVKLFIKQKSSSSDTCMDVSSGCWPSSNASSSSEQQQNNQRCRKKIMHDSDKSCSSGTTARDAIKEDDNLLETELKIVEHTDDDDDNVMTLNQNNRNTALEQVNEDSSYQLDSLDICEESNCSNKDSLNTTPTKKTKSTELYRDAYESSPTHKLRMQQQQHLQQQILRNPQLLNLALQNNNNNNLNKINNNNSLSSDASRTSDNLTQIYCNNNADRIKIPTEVVTRSIQTSFLLKDRVRFVPPSFLAKLNKLGDEKPAPVYVIYPNYALPDLGFVKNNLADIVLSPFNYKAALAAATGNHRNFKIRPKSLTSSQEEVLKNIDYKNITDWKSLVTLLPIEYRKRLKHIPEADIELDPECSMKPLFCMSPPIRRNAVKTNLCDCAMFFQQQQLQQACDSSSGSSHQPSSGYRGSSTLLTDSDFDPPTLTSNSPGSAPALNNIDPLKNMFVYQYENNRIDSEILQEKLPPSGRTPKGILRRNLKSGSQATRLKRNSMFEEENSNVRNLEKRRSLQEPPYDEHNIIEEYLAEAPEDEKELQYYDDMHQNLLSDRNDINCILDNYSKNRNSLERKSRRDYDLDARIRAENFLSNVPKSDLKYYAEIASILESAENNSTNIQYDAVKLKNEVSRALCQQKRVSFIQNGNIESGGPTHTNYLHTNISGKKFTTPPNSPNISMAGLRVNNSNNRLEKENIKEMTQAEKERQNKISSNRFKRLQIQWELLSKDSSMMLKDLASEKETKSGGSTPTSASGGLRSRIPRPVSYPASKPTQEVTKAFRSPSRIVPPKKYTAPPNTSPINAPTHTTALTTVNNVTGQNATCNRARTPNNRISNNGNISTPKQRVQSPRATPRTR